MAVDSKPGRPLSSCAALDQGLHFPQLPSPHVSNGKGEAQLYFPGWVK